MAYGYDREKVIDVNAGSIFRAVGAIVGAIFLLIMVWASIAYVPPGHVGVLTLFGRVTGEALPEGTHFVNPFKVNNTLSIRTRELKETASVPSNEGLMMTLDTSLLFKLDREKASLVYQGVGAGDAYVETLVEPNLRSAIRSVTAAHSANALYTGEREKVAQQIFVELSTALAARGIIVENVLLREVRLPQTLKDAIETKQRAEQESLAMSFRLQKERQEADRKRIEAEGIRDFSRIVAQGISPELLTWKGIEATEKLADSNNTKVIVIGNSKNGLPIILGQQ